MAECRSCHAPIVWAVSPSTGNRMPVDVEPSPQGNIELETTAAETLILAHVYAGEKIEAMKELGRELHLNHFVTCPNRESHRKGATT